MGPVCRAHRTILTARTSVSQLVNHTSNADARVLCPPSQSQLDAVVCTRDIQLLHAIRELNGSVVGRSDTASAPW